MNADPNICSCQQKKPTDTSIEAARNRADAPLFPQHSNGYALARNELYCIREGGVASEKVESHRSSGNHRGQRRQRKPPRPRSEKQNQKQIRRSGPEEAPQQHPYAAPEYPPFKNLAPPQHTLPHLGALLFTPVALLCNFDPPLTRTSTPSSLAASALVRLLLCRDPARPLRKYKHS